MYFTIGVLVYDVLYNRSTCVRCTLQWEYLCTMYLTRGVLVYNVLYNRNTCVRCTLQ